MRFWFLIAAMMGPRFFARFLLFFVLGMGLLFYLDLPPFLTQTVKAQNPLNGELSHGIVS